jgi:hypothetical protein
MVARRRAASDGGYAGDRRVLCDDHGHAGERQVGQIRLLIDEFGLGDRGAVPQNAQRRQNPVRDDGVLDVIGDDPRGGGITALDGPGDLGGCRAYPRRALAHAVLPLVGSTSRGRSAQRLIQIRDEVVRRFDADREAHQVAGHLQR